MGDFSESETSNSNYASGDIFYEEEASQNSATAKGGNRKKATQRLSSDTSSTTSNSKRNKRMKKRNSGTSVSNSSGFLGRLDTSLLASVEFSIDENHEFDIVDVDEEIELRRKKEKNREKMKKYKRKKKLKNVDPRLFPSHQNNKDEEEQDDDELSMDDFEGSTHSHSRSNRSSGSTSIVSAVRGRKMVQLGAIVLPSGSNAGGKEKKKGIDFSQVLAESREEGVVHDIRPNKDITSFSSPVRLLEIENGRAVLVRGVEDKKRKSKTTMSVVAVKQTMEPGACDTVVSSLRKRIANGEIRDFEVMKEEEDIVKGQAKLRRRLLMSVDNINSLNLGKLIQTAIPFYSGYESYLLGEVVEILMNNTLAESNASRKTRLQAKKKTKAELNTMLRFALRNYNVSHVIAENVDRRWDFSWHLFQQVSKIRWYDLWGQIPFVGVTKFPATENFSTPGDWFNKFWLSDPEHIIAHNLSPDCNGFEATNRNQYGTYVGRLKTNEFRIANRLPVDASIVHTFIVSPLSTMIDNGAVHVLNQMEKHWHRILAQPSGNFTHHRLEQLDPFETMRFHMPIVCIVLASLRGRNTWDGRVLGPFIRRCQTLTTSSTANNCLELAEDMKTDIVPTLCASIVTIEKPLSRWLDAIQESCFAIEEEAKEIYKEVSGIEIGLQFGYDLITQVSWNIPSDEELDKAILRELQGEYPGEIIGERNIRRALNLMIPRDKRTLMELIKLKFEKSKAAKTLLGRMKNLLKRDLRREVLNEAIREFSTGDPATESELQTGDWYWLNEELDKKAVYIFKEEEREDDNISAYCFARADTGEDRRIPYDDFETAKCRRYIPVAESIVRAQRCYMNIEIDFCRKFKYNAFAEFSFLKTVLNRLAVVSQIFCHELDNARLSVLQEITTMNQVKVEAGDLEPGKTYYIHNSLYDVYAPFLCQKKFTPSDPEWKKLEKVDMVKVIPQSTVVVGSGVTGLMTTIHCIENILVSGGNIELYETFDSDANEAEVFERAQMVRLDPRWAAMLRYHLGTAFEETFIPTSTESCAHLGNNMVTQGFLEVAIKDLECILHKEITKLWSKGIIRVCMGSKAFYDADLNSFVKLGEHLELGDKVLRRVDPTGKACKEFHRWTVSDVKDAETLGVLELCAGEEYDVYVKRVKDVVPFKLTKVDLYTRTYKFESLKRKIKNIEATPHDLPSVYPKGSQQHFKTVSFKCETRGDSGNFHCDRFSEGLGGKKFVIDIGHSHLVDCTRKLDVSPFHFEVTTSEPCGFCCISRLNRSMLNAGQFDRFNSSTVQHTRSIGDSMKMVRQTFIAEQMTELIQTHQWQDHFKKIIEDSDFSSLNDKDSIGVKLTEAVNWHYDHSNEFRRQTLQMKISETTDNFYVSMELAREYQKWKYDTVDRLLTPQKATSKLRKRLEELKEILRHNIDILWFEACLRVMRHSGVYNKDQIHGIPIMNLINYRIAEELKCFPVGDSFRVEGKTNHKYEIIHRNKEGVFARNADGIVHRFDYAIEVFREGCLTRSIDGDTESKAAVATFPVSQYVNHHSIRLNNESKGYVFASIGDNQSTSHIMHDSALSGGCNNALHFNQFLKSAIEGVILTDRVQLYSRETNWSNLEVIQRCVMNTFGEDAFLRPGFSYRQGLSYIYSQVMGGEQNLDNIRSQDWMKKFASSLIPRGMELNNKFLKTFKEDTNLLIFDLFLEGAKKDDIVSWSDGLDDSLKDRRDEISSVRKTKNQHSLFWEQFMEGIEIDADEASHTRIQGFHGDIAKGVEEFVAEVVNFAKANHLYDQRSSQGLWNQPRPVDSIIGDFAADGRNIPNSLSQSAALCAASVALAVYSTIFAQDRKGLGIFIEICGMFISALNILIAVRIGLNCGLYKNRNVHGRTIYFDRYFLDLKKAIFRLLDTKDRKEKWNDDDNPFLEDLEEKKKQFVSDVVYYGLEDPDEFIYDYRRLLERSDQPAAFKHFEKLLVTYYIPDVYQINSYVQESLVDLYKVCDEIHTLLAQKDKESCLEERQNASELFNRVTKFGPRLETSIDSTVMNSDVYLTYRYLGSLLCISSSKGEMPFSPIETETYGIIKGTKVVSEANSGSVLKRPIHDLEYLHRVTLEGDKGAVVFLYALIVFMSCLLFIVSRILFLAFNGKRFKLLTVIGLWLQMILIMAFVLAFRYYVYYFGHSLWLWVKISVKIGAKKLDKSTITGLRRVKGFIFRQLVLTLIPIITLIASVIAFSWCIALYIACADGGGKCDDEYLKSAQTPYYIALLAICLLVTDPILFYFVECTSGYALPSNLGEVICEAFREEIESAHEELSVTENKFDSKQFQERTTWEYATQNFLRKFRFDAIFRPDRFGPVLQYLQCGLKEKEKVDEQVQC